MKSIVSLLHRSVGRRLAGALAFGLAVVCQSAFAQLYSENFDSGSATGWVVAADGGTWAVSTGTDKTYNSTTSTAGPEISYYDGASWNTGYTYTASVRLWGTGYNNRVGLVYHFQDTSNYYEVELGGALDPNGHNVHLYEHAAGGGSSPVVSGVFSSPGNGNYVTVEVIRSGTTTTIKVGGVTVLTRTQTALTGSGKIGVVDRSASGRFNNITVVDSSPPAVALTSPAAGSVSGTVNVAANASDTGGSGLVGVQFKLDGGALEAEDTNSPFAISWNSTLATNGSHSLTAVARDGAGNLTTSAAVNVTVSNVLPSGWSAGDIGSPTATGATNFSSGTFIVEGGGTNIWNGSDQFQFARQSVTGDCTVIARVNTVQNTARWAKAGVMIRESLDPDSSYVFVLMTPDEGLLFEERATTGDNSTQPGAVDDIDPAQWVKLVRTGNSFSAYYSDDGSDWHLVPGSPTTVSMGSSVYAGLAVCSVNASTVCTATFDNVSITAGGASPYKTVFPKLAGVNFTAKNYESTAYQADLARLDMVIFGFFRNWYHGMSIQAAAQAVKAINPSILLGNYTILETQYNPQVSTDTDYDAYAKLTAEVGPTGNGGTWTPNDWWARSTSGGLFAHGGYAAQKVVNITAFTTPDANGQRFPQWMAQRNSNEFFSPVPEFDIWFLDTVFYRPRENGVDWNRDGVGDSQDDSTVRTYYRQGNVDHVNAIQALHPGMLVMGNFDGNSNASPAQGWLRESQYAGLFAGAMQESAIGLSWSEETLSNGWNVMMSTYRSLIDHTIDPHLVIFNVKGVATDYAVFRYAFASCLMEDGYFSYTREEPVGSGKFPYSNVTWFDEYDLAGTSNTSWLGAAVDPKQRTPKSNGVYIRRFQNGLAIANPKGNGTQTVNLATLFPGETYKRITGTQDSSTNNGATASSVTLNARDGLILVKVP